MCYKVFSDGRSTAKIQTHTGTEEYLVSLTPKASCTCMELQEMVWPCPHILAWDDELGNNPSRHFHKCWRTQSLRILYDGVLPSFVSTDLPVSASCHALEPAVVSGRHRMVRIEQGTRSAALGNIQDLHLDPEGRLFLRYPMDDNSERGAIFPGPSSGDVPSVPRGRGRGGAVHKGRCSVCGEQGHNKRTCTQLPVAPPLQPNKQVRLLSSLRILYEKCYLPTGGKMHSLTILPVRDCTGCSGGSRHFSHVWTDQNQYYHGSTNSQ
jgi:hypothetical protein